MDLKQKGKKGKAFGKHLSEFEYDIIFQFWIYESKWFFGLLMQYIHFSTRWSTRPTIKITELLNVSNWLIATIYRFRQETVGLLAKKFQEDSFKFS